MSLPRLLAVRVPSSCNKTSLCEAFSTLSNHSEVLSVHRPLAEQRTRLWSNNRVIRSIFFSFSSPGWTFILIAQIKNGNECFTNFWISSHPNLMVETQIHFTILIIHNRGKCIKNLHCGSLCVLKVHQQIFWYQVLLMRPYTFCVWPCWKFLPPHYFQYSFIPNIDYPNLS